MRRQIIPHQKHTDVTNILDDLSSRSNVGTCSQGYQAEGINGKLLPELTSQIGRIMEFSQYFLYSRMLSQRLSLRDDDEALEVTTTVLFVTA